MANTTVDVKALARLGAKARLAELIAECDAILQMFPDLGQGEARPEQRAPDAETPRPSRRRRRRPRMSPAQRKAVSERMKKYWAERRKAKAGQAKTSRRQ